MKFKLRKEVQTGIVVIVSLGCLYWGINYLKGIDLFNKENNYYAVYDKIEGLSVSNPVQINGFTVGTVREISFLPDHSGKLLVRFTITDQQFMLPKYTVARIASLDLLGSKSIKLILGIEKDATHKAGDTLRSSVEGSITEEVNRQILPLKSKAEDLLASMDTVIRVIQAILNKEARENLSASFQSIKNTLGTFEVVALRMDTLVFEEKDKLSRIMTNFQSISNNLRNNNENITRILDNVAYISDSIAMSDITTTINNAGDAFKNAANIMSKIERGEGTIGQLVNNDSLYLYLENSARDLDRLLVDIEAHPNRYVHLSVFGRKDKDQRRKDKKRRQQEKEEEKMRIKEAKENK